MKVLLVNIDSSIPNLALKKVEAYHLALGDNIMWNMPLAINEVDKIYVSCIFPENRNDCLIYEGKALIGGSGYDMSIKLPPEIEATKARINWGFTTRGCIRKCYFCFVPKMEGLIHIVSDIYDIWDGKSHEITLMDNNILALPNHFKNICKQIRNENLRVDFNQGLDHRLLTEDLWQELKSLKHIKEIRFAYDDISYKNTVIKALDLMKENGLNDWQTRWYVYVGIKDTFETVYERLILLQSYKQHAYLMRDKQVYDNPMWIALATWTNFQGAFKMDLAILLRENKRFKSYAPFFPKIEEKYCEIAAKRCSQSVMSLETNTQEKIEQKPLIDSTK
jgi:hypothetical protein